jgi:hypothetical protein
MKLQTLFASILSLTFFCLSHAPAATITGYNRASFSTALSGGTVTGQNFDGLANGTILTTLNGVTYGASQGSAIVTDTYLTTTNPNGLGSTSAGFFKSNESATLSFATAITAFGIDINTFAPTAGDYVATINLGNTILSKFDVFPGTSTGQFIGFISDTPFTSVSISPLADPNQSSYSYTLDSLVYGNAAAIVNAASPEPSTVGIFGLGLLLLALVGRRHGALKLKSRSA